MAMNYKNSFLVWAACIILISAGSAFTQEEVRWSDLYRGGENQIPVPLCRLRPELCVPRPTGSERYIPFVIERPADIGKLSEESGDLLLQSTNGDLGLFLAGPDALFVGDGQAWIIIPKDEDYAETARATAGIDPEADIVPICGLYSILCEPGEGEAVLDRFQGENLNVQVESLSTAIKTSPAAVRIKPQDIYILDGSIAVVPNGNNWLKLE
jgi:hypothetical protein